MSTIEEKRVYAGGERTTLYLAADLGVATVSVSGDIVGEFGVDVRCRALDVAGGDGLLAAATDEDVLVGASFEGTDFGPARAVGVGADAVFAADESGDVHRYDGAWERLGAADANRFDGALVAGDDVYRAGETLRALDCPVSPIIDVCDDDGDALAATADGLYRYDGEWARELAGDCRVVSAGGAFAAGPDARDFWGYGTTGRWQRVDLPVEGRVADVVRTGEGTYAVTESGTVLANAGDGWRTRETGLGGVRALATA